MTRVSGVVPMKRVFIIWALAISIVICGFTIFPEGVEGNVHADGECDFPADAEDADDDTSNKGREELRAQYDPYDESQYDPTYIFWLRSYNMSSSVQFLEDYSSTCSGDRENRFNLKKDINETRTSGNPMVFSYPKGVEGFTGEYDDSQVASPFLNFTINALGGPSNANNPDGQGGAGKVINFEVWFDTNGDADPSTQSGIDAVLTFPSYTTVAEAYVQSKGAKQGEESFQITGTWKNGVKPGAMYNGRIYLVMWRTDDVSDDNSDYTADLLVYTGFTDKVSYLGLPFKHPQAKPKADAGKDVGYDFSISDKVPVEFDASGSFDPQDDVGGDGEVDSGDPGEGNENIDDGVPEGEEDLGEFSTLSYFWDFGDGSTSGWISAQDQIITHQYKIIGDGESEYIATLTVRDTNYNTDMDYKKVKVTRMNHAPEIIKMMIRPDGDSQLCFFPKSYAVDYGIMDPDHVATYVPNREMFFMSRAVDLDSDNSNLIYTWDFDSSDGINDVDAEGPEAIHTFKDYGTYTVTLSVFDGPMDGNMTLSSQASLQVNIIENKAPVPKIKARLHGEDGPYVNNQINALQGQDIEFNSSATEPIDQLLGFHLDNDHVADFPLRFQWDWGDGERSVPTFETSVLHNFTGDRLVYNVNLTVMDGEHIVNTTVGFQVKINVMPTAVIDPTITSRFIEATIPETFTSLSIDRNPEDQTYLQEEQDAVVWTFGDGGNAKGSTVKHTYQAEGEYEVTLQVIDKQGQRDSKKVTIYVNPLNQKPILLWKVSVGGANTSTASTGDIFTFDASDSYDPDGENYLDGLDETPYFEDFRRRFWDFGDGNTSDGSVVTHSYADDGTYIISLNFSDINDKFTVETFPVTVLNRRPVFGNDITLNYNVTSEERKKFFDPGSSMDPDGEIVEYRWVWDRNPDSDEHYSTDIPEPVNHTFQGQDDTWIWLIIEDDDGATNKLQINITYVYSSADVGETTWLGLAPSVWLVIILVIAVLVGSLFLISKRAERGF